MHTTHQHQTLARHEGSTWRYAVTATLTTQEALEHYLDWLLDGHINEVCLWAEEAEVVEQSGLKVQSVYWFKDYETFERYEREGAPKLREEGVRFAQELGGIVFERTTGWSLKIK